MPNGTANCILAVCCDPLSDKRAELLADDIVKAIPGVDRDAAFRCSHYFLKSYDVAPAGSLQSFKDAIAKLARENAAHD